MADATIDRSPQGTSQDGSIITALWRLTTADPVGVAVAFPEWADRTWHFSILGGSTATAAIQASPTIASDNNFTAVHDAHGAAEVSAIAATGNFTTVQMHQFMRPVLDDIGTGAIWDVTCTMRRNTDLRQ